MNEQSLLEEVFTCRQHYVALVRANIVHELNERPVVMDVPKQIRQEDSEGDRAGNPDPFGKKYPPLAGQQQPDDDSEAKKQDGVLLFQSQPGKNSEPQPI